MTTRDAALLTWAGVLVLSAAWSLLRGGNWGRSAAAVIRAVLAPRVISLVALVIAWQLLIVYLAAQIGLWNSNLMKDTAVIVVAGGFMAGFKALALMKEEETWRGEVRSVIALVVVIQWVSNLGTFPYLVEFVLVPVAVLLGGTQAVAQHSDDHEAALPVINGIVMTLGLAILGWSAYRVAGSTGSTEWDDVGKAFAMAFWLPAALLPAVYFAALGMQYGKTFAMMKIVRPPSLGAKLDLFIHHRMNLRRLNAFARTPGRAREFARADGKAKRKEILREPTR